MGQNDEAAGSDRQEPWNGEERRRGPRRRNASGEVELERRQGDRRKNSPGLVGLLHAIFRRGDDGR
jgi:hypothetical protein